MSGKPTHETALSLLAGWANQQDHWVRALVTEVFDTGKPVADQRAKHFYEFLLLEKELKDGDKPATPRLDEGGSVGDEEDVFTLKTLCQVERVNALATGQQIEFNPRMTVLFGENAAGKSGYVRILKSLASVRTAEPILPNIFEPSEDGGPQASLTYLLGAKETTTLWAGETAVAPFTRIDVFDARGLLLHVDQELTYVYTPGDLSLFRHVHEAIDKVKKLLDNARQEMLPKGNPYLSKFTRQDPLYTKIESLGSSTDLVALRKLADVSQEEEDALDSLREKVNALRSGSTEARVQVTKGDRALFDKVSITLQVIKAFRRDDYPTALANLAAAEEAHAHVSEQALADLPIPGVLQEPWRNFIEAGEAYVQAIEQSDYPQEGEECIYCRQPLARASADLITKYRDYCNSQFKQAVNDAREALNTATKAILDLEPDRLREELQKKTTVAREAEKPSPLADKCLDFTAIVERLVSAIRQGKPFADDALDPLVNELELAIETQIAQLDKLIQDLGEKAGERKRAFDEESAKLRSLEARLTLRQLLPQITKHVHAMQWADKANTISTRLSYTVAKSLTETSKVASEQLLNRNFEGLFYAECKALRAPAVLLDFPGRRGQAARRKMLVPDHRLSDILSEGEQKVIALADFIAEASLRRTASPIVFDDPVTSLDYRRLDYVVSHLVTLSESRQVIVFTHNIWLATKLLAAFEKRQEACSYYDVTESNGTYGIITRGSHPRWDTFNKTKGRINKLIQDAESATGETQTALIESAYGYIRNITEVIVEQELFCGVTQRYSPHVAMTKLPEIKPERLATAIEAIYSVYEKSCRVIGAHSQPLETLGTRPTLHDLKQDWAGLLTARDEYRTG